MKDKVFDWDCGKDGERERERERWKNEDNIGRRDLQRHKQIMKYYKKGSWKRERKRKRNIKKSNSIQDLTAASLAQGDEQLLL